jgi:hypothetical protein
MLNSGGLSRELMKWRLKRPVKAVRTITVRLTTVLLYVQAATRNGTRQAVNSHQGKPFTGCMHS